MNTTETDRLIIRRFCPKDAEQMHALFTDYETMRLVGMLPAHESFEQTKKRTENWVKDSGHFAVALKESGRVVGYIAINHDSEEGRDDTRELGFATVPQYRGNGYMYEAVRGVVAKLQSEGIRYIWACCFKENKASENLIRKSGFEFRQEGTHQPVNDKEYESLEFCIEA